MLFKFQGANTLAVLRYIFSIRAIVTPYSQRANCNFCQQKEPRFASLFHDPKNTYIRFRKTKLHR